MTEPTQAPGVGHPGTSRRSGRPSMADVAALAEVSAQTVSRVSTGADTVKPQTRRRVLEAMAELGYTPNNAARALRSGTFRTIGVVANRFVHTGISHMIEAIVQAARAEGYAISLVDSEASSPQRFNDALGRVSSAPVDGLIVLRAETTTPEELALPRQLPVVVADSRFLGHHAAVGSDDPTGTRLAVGHLLGLGHATVHHITGPEDSVQAWQRLDSWRRTLVEAGREVPEPLPGDWSPAAGYAQGRVLAADPAVTAVFCANDEMAAGLYRAVHESGRRIPRDISVVGFDDVLAQYLWPPLTSVAQDFEAIGRTLVSTLLAQIHNGAAEVEAHTLVPTRLIVRASTAAPPGPGRRRW